MAFLPKLIFFIFSSLTIFNQSLSSKLIISDIHDLFPLFGLPKGLLPNAIKSYSLSPDGSFEIDLTHPCYVKFDVLVYYDKTIKGKLSYGSVSDITGIQAKELFLWVSVTGMDVDENSDMIEFHVGALSRKLPAEQFEAIPSCRNKACPRSLLPESM